MEKKKKRMLTWPSIMQNGSEPCEFYFTSCTFSVWHTRLRVRTVFCVVVQVWMHPLGSLHLYFLGSEVTGLDPQAVTFGQSRTLQALPWLELSPATPCVIYLFFQRKSNLQAFFVVWLRKQNQSEKSPRKVMLHDCLLCGPSSSKYF